MARRRLADTHQSDRHRLCARQQDAKRPGQDRRCDQEETDGFTYLDPSEFPKLFAPDLPRDRAEFAVRSQVLAAAQVFATPLTAAALKTKPSWGIVAGNDQIINPDLERWYYARAKSQTIEIKGASHSVYG